MPIISNFPTGGGSGGGTGLTLAACTGITTVVAHEKVYVKWTDPDDIVVSGSTLASWGGTILVRKAGSAPVSRRDGTVVVDSKMRNQYKTAYFCDSGLTDGQTYYYKLFPYTTTNAFTDSDDDLFSAVPNAVAPGNVSGMSTAAAGNGKLAISWTDPDATIVTDGITVSTWASTKVVVKAGSYATDPDDADAAFSFNSTTRNAYSSTPLTATGLTNGTTYYVSIFPISTDGAVNVNTANRITGTPDRFTISALPTQSGTLTFTEGTPQTPTWSGEDASKMTKTETAQTNAGTYQTTFTPTEDYKWWDGSTVGKDADWTIGKADPVVTAPSAKTLTYNGGEQTLIDAGSTTGGEMQYSLDDSTYSATLPVGTDQGSYTVYYKVVGGSNYNDVAAAHISVTISKKSLTITAKAQTITYGESIATGTDQVTVSGLASGDALDGITLTPSTANVTTNGTITPSAAVIKDGSTVVTDNYTISYNTGKLTINKAASSVTKAPTGKTGLVYTGDAQALIEAGTASGGTMQYSLDGTTYSANIPTGTNANVSGYTVYYKVVGDSNHNDTAAQTLTVSIAKADFTATVNISNYTYAGTKSTPSISNNPGNGTVTYYGRASTSGTATEWSQVTSTTYNAGTRYCYAVIAETTNYNSYTTPNKSFTIGKATPSAPTLSKTSMTLDSSKTSDTFTVSRTGDGKINVVSSDTGVATVTPASATGSNPQTFTVNSVNSTTGTATVTVTVEEGTNYLAYSGTGAQVAVTATFGIDLETATWAKISEISAAGQGDDYWDIGDTKSILLSGTCGTLSLNTTLYAYIIGFDHNKDKEGSGITFGTWKTADGKDVCLVDANYNTSKSDGTKAFNLNHWGESSSPYNTNYGGWKGCDARYDILGSTKTAPSGYGSTPTTSRVGYDAPTDTATSPVANTLMSCLPSALRAVMKPITKYTDNTGNKSTAAANVTASVDYLPLLSQVEIFNDSSNVNPTEASYQQQYAYYAAGNSKVKYKHSDTGTAALWWERSPHSTSASTFRFVNSTGSIYNISSRYSCGLAPAFLV